MHTGSSKKLSYALLKGTSCSYSSVWLYCFLRYCSTHNSEILLGITPKFSAFMQGGAHHHPISPHFFTYLWQSYSQQALSMKLRSKLRYFDGAGAVAKQAKPLFVVLASCMSTSLSPTCSTLHPVPYLCPGEASWLMSLNPCTMRETQKKFFTWNWPNSCHCGHMGQLKGGPMGARVLSIYLSLLLTLLFLSLSVTLPFQ